MEYVNLGATTLRVSRICFGCAAIGGYDYGEADDAESITALTRAFELGVNFYDVADVYGFGRAETVVQRALGRRANEVIIATKFGVGWTEGGQTFRDISPTHLRRSVEGSLRRLKIDCITLYQIHWHDQKTRWEDCMAALEDCRRDGKILHVGACNLRLEDLNQCQISGRLETLQMPFSLAEQDHRTVLASAVTNFGMTTMAYNVLAHGLFSGKYDRKSKFRGSDLRARVPLFRGAAFDRAIIILERIKEVAARTGRTCIEVALNWALSQSCVSVAITGVRSATQIEGNIAAIGWKLPADEIAFLESPRC